MDWGDIDFGSIVPGMNIFGESVVDWVDTLNVFLDALDEKYFMTQIGGTGTISIPDFAVGMITEQGDGNDAYLNGIRDYWSLLRTIWYGRGPWYTVEALTGPGVASDFVIDDTALEAAIGAGAFAVFENILTTSDYDFHTAENFQAWFKILELMQYRGISLFNGNSDTGASISKQTGIRDIFFTLIRFTGARTINQDDTCIDSQVAVNDAAHADLLADTDNPGSNSGQIWLADRNFYNASILRRGPVANNLYEFKSSYTQWGGHREIAYFENRAGTLLDIPMTNSSARIRRNYKSYNSNPGGGEILYAAGDPQYPQINPGDAFVYVNPVQYIESVTHQNTYGSEYVYSYHGVARMPKVVPRPPDAPLEPCTTGAGTPIVGYLEHLDIEIELLPSSIIDINNSALDFYIAP